ncbi:DUF309 domain-containing protein [Bacillus carboniphilus]|uniref:DUF309 domain-containing protein n=1 Tax=Bacillus carboniphilus TaxID=86663 RepID=A0ABN0WUE4_9BACI
MYPQSYILFLSYFHGNRDYFECHEVLEEYWKSKDGNKDPVWVGLIQTAVGFYHYRRGNLTGAAKVLRKSRKILKEQSHSVQKLGLDIELYLKLLSKEIERVEQCLPYSSVDLPIIDPILLSECEKECEQHDWIFGNKEVVDKYLIHKHKLRDRTEVIEARNDSIKRKNK